MPACSIHFTLHPNFKYFSIVHVLQVLHVCLTLTMQAAVPPSRTPRCKRRTYRAPVTSIGGGSSRGGWDLSSFPHIAVGTVQGVDKGRMAAW